MRDDAARALRVDDEVPRHRTELRSVATLLDEPETEPRPRGGGPSPEATMALRHFERLAEADPIRFGDDSPSRARRFARDDETGPVRRPERSARRGGDVASMNVAELVESSTGQGQAAAAPAAELPAVEPVRGPRNAPGRTYGSHFRGDGALTQRVAGYQAGRRTVEITGHVQAPRRPSQTSAALMSRPDRVALWAFMLALFLVLMAVATAQA
jgi:hypothetical protein